MSIFKRKKGNYNVVADTCVTVSLPTHGEGLENYVPTEYPANDTQRISDLYTIVEGELNKLVQTCDQHSNGDELDIYIDAQIDQLGPEHEEAIAKNENQIVRINACRAMRKGTLDRKIALLEEKMVKLQSEIAPLVELRSQFQLRIGRHAISLGALVTIAAMVVDAFVNYGFLQTVLLSNSVMLWITVFSMSLMSDGTMWALGTYLSRKREKFTSPPLFWIICSFFISMFVLSVVTSILIRFGSMDATYGTINAAGEFVGKNTYSFAEYGITLATAFVTTATGILSFAFSLDENEYLVSCRERKQRELAEFQEEFDALVAERTLIEKAPDPREWDMQKRNAAEHQMEALRSGLKIHCRKLIAEFINSADFTEKMAISGENLLRGSRAIDKSTASIVSSLDKAS